MEEIFGFKVAPFSEERANKYGLDPSLKGGLITDISIVSSARRAGLNEGDLIVAVNRKSIYGVEDFNKVAQSLKKGDTVFFRIVRKNRNFYVAFTL